MEVSCFLMFFVVLLMNLTISFVFLFEKSYFFQQKTNKSKAGPSCPS